MTVKNIIDIFGFISIDDINLPIGTVFYITDKEDSYALIVDNTIDDKLKSIAICHSAWSLYMQYKSYIKDNIWILKDLKHGEDAVKQLKAMGKYYNKKRN